MTSNTAASTTTNTVVGSTGPAPGGEIRRVLPADHGGPLVNPMMGWCFHHYDNAIDIYGHKLDPSDTLRDFPGLSTVYLRTPWSCIEPEDEQYDWSVLDSVAQRYIDRGLRVAYRISACESELPYGTPKWVFDAGARGIPFGVDGGVEPDYADPIFLRFLERFLARFAARYDGDPSVDFVDVGSMGVWGEGHTHRSSMLPFSTDVALRHIDLHAQHFTKTLLVVCDEMAQQGRGSAVFERARRLGMSLREDSVLVWGNQPVPAAWVAQQFWPNVPFVLESQHYGFSRDGGHWGDGEHYLHAVEQYHASYASIHWYAREFLDENRDVVDRINRVLGYRVRPAELSWSARATVGGTVRFDARWVNTGVAPCYPGGNPCYTLKDDRDGIVAVFVDRTTEIRSIPLRAEPVGAYGVQPGESGVAFRVPPNVAPGTYRLFVSVGRPVGTPTIAMPLDRADAHRRYEVGAITIDPASHSPEHD